VCSQTAHSLPFPRAASLLTPRFPIHLNGAKWLSSCMRKDGLFPPLRPTCKRAATRSTISCTALLPRAMQVWKINRVHPISRHTKSRCATSTRESKLASNPDLGAYRVMAALEQIGIKLSQATCGRLLALNRSHDAHRGPQGREASPEKRHALQSLFSSSVLVGGCSLHRGASRSRRTRPYLSDQHFRKLLACGAGE
jgi:hypothetical protein